MVVDYDLYDWKVVPRSRSELVHIHTEAPVSCDVYAGFIGISNLCAYAGSKSIAHRAKSSRCKDRPWIFEFVVLGSPHLVLTYICRNDGFAARQLVKLLNDIGTGQFVFFIGKRELSLVIGYLFEPLGVLHLIKPIIEHLENRFKITDNRDICPDILVDLSRIYIDLQYLSLGGKGLGVSYYPVGEPRSKRDQKVALADTIVRCLGAVHADHARVELVLRVKSALAHKGIADRRINLLGKLLEFIISS